METEPAHSHHHASLAQLGSHSYLSGSASSGSIPHPAANSQYPTYGHRGHPRSSAAYGTAGNQQTNNLVALKAMEELYELERSEAARRAEFEARRLEAIRRAEAGLGVSMNFTGAHHSQAFGHANDHGHQEHHQHHHHTYPHRQQHPTRSYTHGSQQRRMINDVETSPSLSPTESDCCSLPPAGASAYLSGSPVASFSRYSSHPHDRERERELQREGRLYTPSTSPFLGGIRQLDIHSTDPSRAPSPVFLPQPHVPFQPASSAASSRQASPTLHHAQLHPLGHGHSHSYHAHSHAHHPYAHPQGHGHGHGHGHSYKRRSFGAYESSSSSAPDPPPTISPTLSPSPTRSTFPGYPYSSDRTLLPRTSGSSSDSGTGTPITAGSVPGSGAETPALSIGSAPSSTGSSPGNHHFSLHVAQPGPPMNAPPPPVPGSMSTVRSANSSRAPSPSLAQPQQNTHHLATSLRLAFGMTPIRPVESHQRGERAGLVPAGSSSGLNASARSNSASELRSLSMLPPSRPAHHVFSVPASRAASPPITLPPLKLSERHRSNRSDPTSLTSREDDEMDIVETDFERVREVEKANNKVKLPHFNEIDPSAAHGHVYGGLAHRVSGMVLDGDSREVMYAQEG